VPCFFGFGERRFGRNCFAASACLTRGAQFTLAEDYHQKYAAAPPLRDLRLRLSRD
jgi:peptide methionine sulfoxide reductase MsrA